MGIGEPLRRPAAHAGNEADIGADAAAAQHELPVTEGIFDPFHDPAEFGRRLIAGDARSLDRQIDDLGNREESDGDGNERNAVPKKQRVVFAQKPSRVNAARFNRVEARPSRAPGRDRRRPAPSARSAAERRDESDAEQREHEKLRRADRQDQRGDDGDRQRQQKAPNTAPTNELISAAPSARPASPFLAIGWPSTMVAAVIPSPGTPKSTEVISPVVAVTALEPRRKANAVMGSML